MSTVDERSMDVIDDRKQNDRQRGMFRRGIVALLNWLLTVANEGPKRTGSGCTPDYEIEELLAAERPELNAPVTVPLGKIQQLRRKIAVLVEEVRRLTEMVQQHVREIRDRDGIIAQQRREIEQQLQEIAEKDRRLAENEELMRRAGSRMHDLGPTFAWAMNYPGARINRPQLDTRMHAWSTTRINDETGKRLAEVHVPIFDPERRLVVCDYSHEGRPRVRTFSTRKDGTIDDDTLLMARGFAACLMDERHDGTRGIEAVLEGLEKDLKVLVQEPSTFTRSSFDEELKELLTS